MEKIGFASLFNKLKKYRILILVVGLVLLSISQQKVVMPIIYDVIKSDLFLVDSKDKGSDLPVSTPLSNIAFTHCNNYIKSKSAADATINFSEKPLKSWDIGNYQYIINAEVVFANKSPVPAKYTCRITYNKGDNQEDVLNIDNWSIIGVAVDGVGL
jgi:hypothetical protein